MGDTGGNNTISVCGTGKHVRLAGAELRAAISTGANAADVTLRIVIVGQGHSVTVELDDAAVQLQLRACAIDVSGAGHHVTVTQTHTRGDTATVPPLGIDITGNKHSVAVNGVQCRMYRVSVSGGEHKVKLTAAATGALIDQLTVAGDKQQLSLHGRLDVRQWSVCGAGHKMATSQQCTGGMQQVHDAPSDDRTPLTMLSTQSVDPSTQTVEPSTQSTEPSTQKEQVGTQSDLSTQSGADVTAASTEPDTTQQE